MMDKNQNLEAFLEKRSGDDHDGGNGTYQAMENDRKDAAKENGYGKANGGQGKMGDYSGKYKERSRIPAGITPMIWSRHILTSQRNPFFYLLSEDQNTGIAFLNHLEHSAKAKE